MVEPHPRASCGIVKARERSQARGEIRSPSHYDRDRPRVK